MSCKVDFKVPIKPKLDAKLDMGVLREERSKTQFSIEVNNYYDMLAQERKSRPQRKKWTPFGKF